MLFDLALEWVMQNTPHAQDSLTLDNGLRCDRLAYADDADLCGEEFQGRDVQLEQFSTTGGRIGLGINEPKTKAMKAGREERTEDFIELGDFLLEEVDSFKYLGSIVQSDSGMEEEVAARIAGGSKCGWAVNSLLKSRLLSWTTRL